jgi:hypothetical protein
LGGYPFDEKKSAELELISKIATKDKGTWSHEMLHIWEAILPQRSRNGIEIDPSADDFFTIFQGGWAHRQVV